MVIVTTAMHVPILPSASVIVSVTLLGPRSAIVKVFGTAFFEAIPQLSVDPLSISSAVIEAFPRASRATEISLHNATGFSSSARIR